MTSVNGGTPVINHHGDSHGNREREKGGHNLVKPISANTGKPDCSQGDFYVIKKKRFCEHNGLLPCRRTTVREYFKSIAYRLEGRF